MKIIYYYQTFNGLSKILNDPNNNVTHIHLSSIHFDQDDIHLNDYSPYDPRFKSVWDELNTATQTKNIKVILMVGGAGSAYRQLFTNFDKYYDMLFKLINKYRGIIKGVDLDIEEDVNINDIYKLILRLKSDFGLNFIIAMAPVQSSIENDVDGMGGFVYKDLYKKIGNLIDYFNVQCYAVYNLQTMDNMIKNGYPSNKINMGMMSWQYNNDIPNTVKSIVNKYPDFGGVFDWEYGDAVENWNHRIIP